MHRTAKNLFLQKNYENVLDIRIGFKTRRGLGRFQQDELIDLLFKFGAPMEVVENLQELKMMVKCRFNEDIWPDYPDKDDFFFNEDEY